ncbi:MAG: dihydroorotate dehydrogenase electron transfer subunit [Planctomycetota bacterium]|nr:MAG: dihydroorotate dehydrogenase electron transfer subunit [Planctomycetota bacterium]
MSENLPTGSGSVADDSLAAWFSELPGLVCDATWAVGHVVERERMARETYRLRIECPAIAARILPGQFVMLRPAEGTDPLLGRPFALFDVADGPDGTARQFDIGFVVVGKLTRRMSRWEPGCPVAVWGPLGNGFPTEYQGHLVCVAGGIGQTPFLAVAREALGLRRYGSPPRQPASQSRRVTVLYGVRSAELLAGVEAFRTAGAAVFVSTDDGTQGHRGLVTDLLAAMLGQPLPAEQASATTEAVRNLPRPDRILCCGPEPMMQAVARLANEHGIPCWLSLETPMACGFGACFSCVVRVREQDGWDYRRTCVEGPVFAAERLAEW